MNTCSACSHSSQLPAVHEKEHPLLRKAEVICMAVIAIFSAFKSPKYFFPIFLAGVAYGTTLPKQNSAVPIQTSSCSLGFMEQLTQQPLPPQVRLFFNFAIFLDHLHDHHSVYSLMAAASFGIWCGKHITALRK